MRLLSEVKPTLPASWYYDGGHFKRELEAIWYRDWVSVGRMVAAQAGSVFPPLPVVPDEVLVALCTITESREVVAGVLGAKAFVEASCCSVALQNPEIDSQVRVTPPAWNCRLPSGM